MDKHEKRLDFQQSIAEKYDAKSPTEVDEVYWLYAERKQGEYPRVEPGLSGKWLIFVHKDEINEVWDKIKQATEDGKLGNRCKVSTSKPNPNSANKDTHVICVYTYNWKDEEDVMEVRENLRELGITQKTPYKSDEDTMKGKYANKGNKRISKYYC